MPDYEVEYTGGGSYTTRTYDVSDALSAMIAHYDVFPQTHIVGIRDDDGNVMPNQRPAYLEMMKEQVAQEAKARNERV